MFEKDFITQKLNFGNKAQIDQRVIISGHSMGGGTALKAGDDDDRIKMVVIHDPWVESVRYWIDSFDKVIKKPLFFC